MMILPAVAFMRSTRYGIGLGEGLGGVIEARLGGAPVQLGGLGLALAELLHQRLVDLFHFDGEQLRHHAVVDHVADQLAQLGIRADRRHQLVEGHGVEVQVGAQCVELQRLVVNHGGAGIQLHDVFARGFRVHGHQEIDFLPAADVAVLAGADGEPGGQPGDIRREHVLPRNRDAHLKDGAHQDGVGGLAARPIDGGDLNAEIVDNRGTRLAGQGLDRRDF